MLDATRIEPGQRYAWRIKEHPIDNVWHVGCWTGDHPFPATNDDYPIVEPERLHEIKVGSTVLNVATGEQFEWDALRANMLQDVWHVFTPLLALVATPEDT